MCGCLLFIRLSQVFSASALIDIWGPIIHRWGWGGGVVPCIAECLPAYQVPIDYMLVVHTHTHTHTYPNYDNERCFQTLPNIPWDEIGQTTEFSSEQNISGEKKKCFSFSWHLIFIINRFFKLIIRLGIVNSLHEKGL